ncbi:MAG: DUF3857 domain-containing protein [Planctomycetes bacterium]|nr:DUF3857 domain-containing protein [Planctomycetota bacterium]
MQDQKSRISRSLRYIVTAALFLLLFASSAMVLEAASGEVWDGLAGRDKELEAEHLELRDELIAAQLGYLAALTEALAEIEVMPEDDSRLAPAWARMEHLLETAFRLLNNTGEHEAFLQATAGLKPDAVPVAAAVSLDTPEAWEDDSDGGLTYWDDDDRRLSPVLAGNGYAWIDSRSGESITPNRTVIAKPATDWTKPGREYIPSIKARAAWLRALTLERRGRTAEAKAEVAGLGLIRDWVVLGPLDGDFTPHLSQSLHEFYQNLDASLDHPGKNGPVRWRPSSSEDPLGRLFLDSLFRTPGPKAAAAIALVYSSRNGAAELRFGSTSPVVVGVNHVTFQLDKAGGSSEPDQAAVPVWLRKGWNVVVVRTTSGSGSWNLAARLTTPEGLPFPAVAAKIDSGKLDLALENARKAVRRSLPDQYYQPDAIAGMGGILILSERLADNPNSAVDNFYLASLLVARRMREGAERFDREEIFSRAVKLSNGNPFFTLMAARSVDTGIEGPDREENHRLMLLKAVADQGSVAALVDMGRLYLDVMRQPRKAGAYAELALSINPMSLHAGVLDYDAVISMGWQPVAKMLLERLTRLHPTAAPARLRLGRTSLADGRPRQALTEFHAVLGADAANREALDGAIKAMGMLGLTSGAEGLLVGHIERFPYDSEARLKLADLYRMLGRDADAGRVLDAALALAPDDPEAAGMLRDIVQTAYVEGGGGNAAEKPKRRNFRQELDDSPPTRPPPGGWEYLYFQVEDRMEKFGAIDRTVSFALKVHTDKAARLLRHLDLWLERDFERGVVVSLELLRPNGVRESFTHPASSRTNVNALKFSLPPLETGTVIEAEVEIRRERVLFLGDYFGQVVTMTQQAPVRLSRYIFTAPKERRGFFRPTGGAPQAMGVEAPDGQEATRIWEMNDLPAFVPEPYSPGKLKSTPCVQISFFSDWDEFARWYWRFIGPQYHAPPELRSLAARLAEDDPNPLVRLDSAAKWVAGNIGHREWEYGPYAFRPINARSILSRLSADGKDRTLLLCLLAREYGLEAWPVLAQMRDRRFEALGTGMLSLPLLDSFNHSLVMVETGYGDHVFLDASNPYRPPGVMPSPLFGGSGVAITPVSAKEIVIPEVGSGACVWEETADLVLDEDGSALWEVEVKGMGTAAEALRFRFMNTGTCSEEWAVFLSGQGTIPSAVWGDFREHPETPAAALFSGRARLRYLAMIDGDRVMLEVPPLPGPVAQGEAAFPLSLDFLAIQGTREQDLELPYAFKLSRRIRISYPEEWRLENPCQPFRLVHSFGTLALACETGPGNLVIQFEMEVPGHRLAAEDFSAFREMAALAKRGLQPFLVWERP